MPLTDTAIRGCKPRDKPYKLADEKGLFLLVQPSGGKPWRLKYRVAGVEKKLALGTHPDLELREVRERRDEDGGAGRRRVRCLGRGQFVSRFARHV